MKMNENENDNGGPKKQKPAKTEEGRRKKGKTRII
jgi:hypothetical protein